MLNMAKANGRQTKPTGEKITVSPAERAAMKKRRLEIEWKQGDLADRLNVSQATISNLESGRHPQLYKSVYAEAKRVLKIGNAKDAPEDTERFNRVVDKFLQLSTQHQAAVEQLIDSLLKP